MNLANRIENALISIGTALLVIVAIHFISIKPLERQIEKQNMLIERLAKIEKYKIENDFGKMKPKGGSDIIIDLDNDMKIELDSMIQNTTMVEDKKGFFKRLFN